MAWLRLEYLLAFIILQIGVIHSKSQLIALDENDWDRMLTGEWMVEFFAPWCPACKALQPAWEDFSTWSKDLGLSVAQVDVTKAPGLSGRFMVTALPTIMHVNDGIFRVYKGSRDKESFISFIEDKKWKQIEEIPGWKSPASLQMSVVASFFKLSQTLRSWHNKLMDEYGLPSYGSYIIFAIATIALGAILGLMMVCCIDYFWPPKIVHMHRKKSEEPSAGDSEEESIQDELVDEEDEMADEDNANVRKRKVPKAN